MSVAVLALMSEPRAEQVPFVTPVGITIVQADIPNTDRSYYADANGMALYFYQHDEPDQSSCYEECAQTWLPLIASKGSNTVAQWSLVTRHDGRKQWAYERKALYKFAHDKVVGEVTGGSALHSDESSGTGGSSVDRDDSWQVAFYAPLQIPAPSGIAVAEVPDANGEVLVNENGMTLYASAGEPNPERERHGDVSRIERWRPLRAARLARSIGEFKPVDRDDGIRQWTFEGKALYTFDGDVVVGDAKGVGIDRHWHAARVRRFYLPAQVRIGNSLGLGKVLTTANGMVLYRHTYTTGGSLPRGIRHMSQFGRLFGTRSCDTQCLKSWRPLLAPSNAEARDFWQIVTRADGENQWSYKGYALYRYVGDQRAGDVMGVGDTELIINSRLAPAQDSIASLIQELQQIMEIQVSFVWAHMYP